MDAQQVDRLVDALVPIADQPVTSLSGGLDAAERLALGRLIVRVVDVEASQCHDTKAALRDAIDKMLAATPRLADGILEIWMRIGDDAFFSALAIAYRAAKLKPPGP